MYIFNKKRIIFINLSIVFSIFVYVLANNSLNFQATSSTPISNHTIILDAGHGNPDGGATGNDGSIESDLNLDIVLKLQNLLESSNCTVILTRSDENGIYEADSNTIREKKISDMKNRVEIANNSNAEMFVSIHMNKLEQTQYSGWQTFYKNQDEDSKTKDFDEEVMSCGIDYCNKLNEKYKTDKFSKFHFLYRERIWNSCEEAYIGWERKRGLLTTFNKYIKRRRENNFLENTIEKEKEKLPNIKYIITLDSDTNLNLNTASKLIGAMSHLLNIPIVKNDKVVDGYGIMQPRIGMDLSLSQKSLFIELFSMKGGVDFYTNAISDIYQDYFEEGIFTGKGIYDVDLYNTILRSEFPDNTILSHDLLEGNFLRCGLITDVMLLDGYPSRYLPYIMRNHRWTRGDWQIIKWLKNDRLNEISKFKIYDNLRRSVLQITAFALIIISIFNFSSLFYLFVLGIISCITPYLIDIINYIIFKESNITGAVYAYKKFSNELNSLKISIIRIILQILFLPFEMYKNLDSIIRSLYRMKKCKKTFRMGYSRRW